MILLITFLTAAAASIANCETKSVFTITKLDQVPLNNVVGNENVSLTLFYTSPEVITGGRVETSLTYNFIPITPTTSDLCTVVGCPITIGEHDGSSWYTFPTGLAGRVIAQVKWYDTTGRVLLCIKSIIQSKFYRAS